jgi:hypothetical protein
MCLRMDGSGMCQGLYSVAKISIYESETNDNQYLPATMSSQNITMHNIAFHFAGLSSSPSRLRHFQSHRGSSLIMSLETKVCKIRKSGGWLHEGCHTPLSKPSLEGDVSSITSDSRC